MKLNLGEILRSDPEVLKKDGLILFNKLIRTKNPTQHQQEDETTNKSSLQKCLTTLDLTSLGVGSCAGTGMYLVSGMVARTVAGPGVILSFIIAAIASIFSGACYAEFGVRVPNTCGSAYMYSYVTVGEFIAFIIGWNMILEYLIGTSACACALSACFDAITNGYISNKLTETIGTIYGRPPDILGFLITLGMMMVLVAGVQKSLLFNNVLNVINFVTWIFIMTVGLFYIDFSNWSDYGGFLPFGWSGVLTGAATCFYAFIGFDIIATTGEEATNPKKSIPLAIIGSLVIILIAYVSSSTILTLLVPYDEVVKDSGLVEMFGQVGAKKSQFIVGIGALAGLTVSMFGSMFPMPRIVYAMAKDGLIFKWLGEVWELTGTPAVATIVFGCFAALFALFIQLEVLVEMMSIGTLLAYTLVSSCVLLLRYHPPSINLIDLLPESMRTPIPGTPLVHSPIKHSIHPTSSTASLFPSDGTTTTHRGSIGLPGPVLVRKVTRKDSVDSDDTDTIGDGEGDDAFLIGGDRDSRYYGSLHASQSPRMSKWESHMRVMQYMCPKLFPWKENGPATEESGKYVTKLVGILFLLIICFDLFLVAVVGSSGFIQSIIILILIISFIGIIITLLIISRKPQNSKNLLFMTPGLPFVPAIAIMINFYLILKLSILTLVRFTIWMILGFIMYFKYGIKKSELETTEDPPLELTVAGRNNSNEFYK